MSVGSTSSTGAFGAYTGLVDWMIRSSKPYEISLADKFPSEESRAANVAALTAERPGEVVKLQAGTKEALQRTNLEDLTDSVEWTLQAMMTSIEQTVSQQSQAAALAKARQAYGMREEQAVESAVEATDAGAGSAESASSSSSSSEASSGSSASGSSGAEASSA